FISGYPPLDDAGCVFLSMRRHAAENRGCARRAPPAERQGRGAYLLLTLFRPSRRLMPSSWPPLLAVWEATAISRIKPRITCCQKELTPFRFRPLRITPIISAPMMVLRM